LQLLELTLLRSRKKTWGEGEIILNFDNVQKAYGTRGYEAKKKK
jgi:hypothetical protein